LKPPRWLFRTVACLILGGQVVGRICKGGRGAAGTKGLGVSGGVTGDGERGVDHHSVAQQLYATTIVIWQCVGPTCRHYNRSRASSGVIAGGLQQAGWPVTWCEHN
jgi:hypothetical protein